MLDMLRLEQLGGTNNWVGEAQRTSCTMAMAAKKRQTNLEKLEYRRKGMQTGHFRDINFYNYENKNYHRTNDCICLKKFFAKFNIEPNGIMWKISCKQTRSMSINKSHHNNSPKFH